MQGSMSYVFHRRITSAAVSLAPSEVERVTTNVLVVDDEEIICTLFAAMLSQYGSYHVVTTTDGRQVMDILRREPFHVVLLDMSMPAISGLDLLRQITQAFEEVSVIIVQATGVSRPPWNRCRRGRQISWPSLYQQRYSTCAFNKPSSTPGRDGLPVLMD